MSSRRSESVCDERRRGIVGGADEDRPEEARAGVGSSSKEGKGRVRMGAEGRERQAG